MHPFYNDMYRLLIKSPPPRFPDGNMDDKSAVKAKGLWEDWHMRQLSEQTGRVNHRSGTAATKSVGMGTSQQNIQPVLFELTEVGYS